MVLDIIKEHKNRPAVQPEKEYDDYVLVQFIPLSLWEKIAGQAERTETDTYIRIQGRDGIAKVFSNTLGFLYQRKREFAQYMSVGMTQEGMRKMFCIEALVITGRPVLSFVLIIFGFVAMAYYIGGRRLQQSELNEAKEHGE